MEHLYDEWNVIRDDEVQMSSIRQVAMLANVSPATASRALNHSGPVSPAARSRVLMAAQRVGYRGLGRVTAGVSRIGVAYPHLPVLAEFGGFDAALLSGIARGAAEERCDLALVDIAATKQRAESYTHYFERHGLQGVVVRAHGESRHVCETIAEEGFPSVVVADRFENPDVNFVCYNSEEDSRRAIEHLISLGHRRIGLCVHMVRDSDHDDRRRAYESTLRAHGIEIDPELIVEVIANAEGGESAFNRLLGLPRPPTAIFFTDPLATVGGIRRALETGVRVPEELSIVGFDDSDLRKITHPMFTAVCQDAIRMGRIAGKWIASRIHEETTESLRLRSNAYFEINRTSGVAPPQPVRLSPQGERLEVHERTGTDGGHA